MTSWATLTLEIEENDYGRKEFPTGLLLDSGIDEYGQIDENTYYALSFGRYQDERFRRHMEDMHSPRFTGIHIAYVSHVEDTGDEIELDVYRPKQRWSEERLDGYEKIREWGGKRWPDEERVSFEDKMERIYNLRPVIEPIENITPPDMVCKI